jgi:hypothetical protein
MDIEAVFMMNSDDEEEGGASSATASFGRSRSDNVTTAFDDDGDNHDNENDAVSPQPSRLLPLVLS